MFTERSFVSRGVVNSWLWDGWCRMLVWVVWIGLGSDGVLLQCSCSSSVCSFAYFPLTDCFVFTGSRTSFIMSNHVRHAIYFSCGILSILPSVVLFV